MLFDRRGLNIKLQSSLMIHCFIQLHTLCNKSTEMEMDLFLSLSLTFLLLNRRSFSENTGK